MSNLDRTQLRQTLRQRRNELSPAQQQLAAESVLQILLNSGYLDRFRDIGIYLAYDGEIGTEHIIEHLQCHNTRCYLPILSPDKRLQFARYLPNQKMRNNQFGIAEPIGHQDHREPWELDLVLLPLVGFDRQGGRLGMGGGFYDRSFSFIKTQSAMSRPLLIGLAHHCQEVDKIAMNDWDIPIDKIATDLELIDTAGR